MPEPLKIFVASSKEGKKIQTEIRVLLEKTDVHAIDWQSAFDPGNYNLENLINAVSDVDGALFILTPDDLTFFRGELKFEARDNVTFELGMFIAALGKERAVCVVHEIATNEQAIQARIQSDYLGVKVIPYNKNKPATTETYISNWVEKLKLNKHIQQSSVLSRSQNISQGIQEYPSQITSFQDEFSKITEHLRQGLLEIKKEIYCPLQHTCKELQITKVFATRKDAYQDLLADLRTAESTIDIIGVSLRSFFTAWGDYYKDIMQTIRTRTGPKWRILIVDFESEDALLRSLREDSFYYSHIETPILDYSKLSLAELKEKFGEAFKMSHLYKDVSETIETLNSLQDNQNIEARVYRGSISSFAVAIDNNSLYLEQYHYGIEGKGTVSRAAEQVPVFKYQGNSSMSKQMLGHFDHIWMNLSVPISERVAVKKLRSKKG